MKFKLKLLIKMKRRKKDQKALMEKKLQIYLIKYAQISYNKKKFIF